MPSAIRSLWKDELADRIDVPPLDHDSTAKLVGDLLAAEGQLADEVGAARSGPAPDDRVSARSDRFRNPVGGQLSESVWRMSNGNPLYARELVLNGSRQGRITLRDGAWQLDGDLDVGPRLTELLRERLSALTDEQMETLELVAYSGPLPLRVLLHLVPVPPVEALQRNGLLLFEWSRGEQLVRTGHPVTTEMVRHGVPVTRAADMGRRLADAFEQDGRMESELLRVVTWRLQAGVPCDHDALVRASLRAAENDEWQLAAWVAGAAYESGPDAEAALALADAQRALGRFREGLITLEDQSGEGDDQIARILVLRAAVLYFGLGRLTAALETLRTGRERIEGGSDRTWLEAVEAGMLGFAGRPSEAAERAGALLGRPGLSVRTELTVRSVLAMSLAWTGRTERAVEVLDGMTGGTEQFAVLASWAVTARVVTHRVAGRVELVERLSRSRYELAVRTRDRHSQGAAAASLGWAALQRGRLPQAVTWFREATTALRRGESPVIGLNTLMNLAETLALSGDVDGARAALDQARPGAEQSGRSSTLWAVATAWLAAAQGALSEAVEGLARAAEAARRMGQIEAELRALHAMVRLGSDQATPRLVQMASWAEGPFVAAIAQHAQTLAQGDDMGEALDEVAERYADLGLNLYAAEAAAQACQAHRAIGNTRRAAASSARGHFLLGAGDDRDMPLGLTLALIPPELTRREREVAMQAARGLPSQAIATRLCLSVRTVETHLARVYLKLGIGGRTELALALLQGGVREDHVEAG